MNYLGELQYKHVVTFGDSTTDSGNAYRLSAQTWPIVPPFNRRGGFADDLLWNEYFTFHLSNSATLDDYACGSATTDNRLAQGIMARNPNLIANYSIRSQIRSPGVRQQIFQYISSMISQSVDFEHTLYLIWVGTNNYFFNSSLTPLDTVTSILDDLNLLITYGGRHFVIINEPPFDRFPAFRYQINRPSIQQLYIDHNRILNERFHEKYSNNFTRLNVHLFDSYSFISKIMDQYKNYGFENLNSCWDTQTSSTVLIQCDHIDQRMFSDEYHFTSKMQTMIALELYQFLDLL